MEEDLNQSPLPKKFGLPLWTFYALGAAVSFSFVNTMLNEIAEGAGPFVQVYLTGGYIIGGLVYNIKESWKNYKETGVFYNHQNIIKDDRFNCRNFIAFFLYTVMFSISQNCVYLTIYFAG